jgi:Protein of unknown function (DUF2934)
VKRAAPRKNNTEEKPMSDMTRREQRVRERAYHLWEIAGKPHGDHHRFWQEAEAQIRQEEEDPRPDPPPPMPRRG